MKTRILRIIISLAFLYLYQVLGHRVRMRRIVQGSEAVISEWPFVAWLVMERSPAYAYCGAALIKSDFALTAAHCVEAVENNPSYISLRVGSTQRQEMKRLKSLQYNISEVIIHPKYKDKKVAEIYDIALIKLSEEVKINIYTFVRPVRISLWAMGNKEMKKLTCKLAGWGKTDIFDSIATMTSNRSKPSAILQETTVPLLSTNKCTSLISSFFKKNNMSIGDQRIRKSFVCGGSFKAEGSVACLHDSGAPLVCEGEYGDIELHGITVAVHGPDIRKRPCNPETQFSIFIRVSNFARWILKAVKKYS